MKTPTGFIIAPLLLPLFLALHSCKDPAEKMAKGFRLPDGNIEKGQAAFIEMKCHQCHTVAGVNLPIPDVPSKIGYVLGGEVRKVRSYGELVTSIIQPQHILAPEYLEKLEKEKREGAITPMPAFNDRMTVKQLTNIVTFLHSHYQKAPPPGANYPVYMP
jgi:L-cysteine S-thiosulfotransferase